MTELSTRGLLPVFTQPLGALPWPAGMLLLGEGADVEATAWLLRRGGEPDVWPVSTAFLAAALRDDLDAALASLDPDDPLSRYNEAVLVGDAQAWEVVAHSELADDPVVAALVHTARYSLGLVQTAPDPLDGPGEVEAVVHAARASAALEAGDFDPALDELDSGATAAQRCDSPVLAASLRGTRAELLRDQLGRPQEALEEGQRALALLESDAVDSGSVRELKADLTLTLALTRQELAVDQPQLLTEVIADLQRCLHTYTEDDYPEQFAVCSHHLALAYLVLPASQQADRIRSGVAVNALRGALRVYRPETHPVAWASTTLNLANALQYLPSAVPEQHLTEAVDLYEQVLQHRDATRDPVGSARVLANQGNALAHLGAFVDAHDRLGRARRLFVTANDTDGVAHVDELLAGVLHAERAAPAAQGG